jgi:hypothetical protein
MATVSSKGISRFGCVVGIRCVSSEVKTVYLYIALPVWRGVRLATSTVNGDVFPVRYKLIHFTSILPCTCVGEYV